jgi:hypothetical protein
MSKERFCMYRAACPTLLFHSLLPSRTVQEMSKLFRQQTIRKAAGPDNVSSSTLKNCANESDPVFRDLFNASLHQNCVKAATIIPLQKNPKRKPWTTSAPWLWCQWWWRFWSYWSLRVWSLSQLQYGSIPDRLNGKPMHWCCCCICPILYDETLRAYQHICTHPVRRLQFRVQRGHTWETFWQASTKVTRCINMFVHTRLF